MEFKGITSVLMGNYQGVYYQLYKYLCLHYIGCIIIQMYGIALMINIEILISFLLVKHWWDTSMGAY